MALTWPFHCDLILQRLLYSQATHLLYPNIVHVVALLISNTVESINHYPKLPSEKWWRSIQEKIGTILGLSFVPTFVCSCCVIAAPDSGLWYCYWHRVRALASVLPSGLPCLSYSCWPVTLSGCWLALLACLDCLIRVVTRKVPAWGPEPCELRLRQSQAASEIAYSVPAITVPEVQVAQWQIMALWLPWHACQWRWIFSEKSFKQVRGAWIKKVNLNLFVTCF